MTESKFTKMIQVFGFGGAGANTIKYVQSNLGDSLEYVGIDTDNELAVDARQLIHQGTKVLVLTAGMGGKTGTNGIISIAKAGKERNILTVAVVTMPFDYEKEAIKEASAEGIKELRKYADTLLTISNNKLRELYHDLPFQEAFAKCDDVLLNIAKSVSELLSADTDGTVRHDIETFFRKGELAPENKVEETLRSAIASGNLLYDDLSENRFL